MTDQAPALLQPELLRSLFPVLQQQVKELQDQGFQTLQLDKPEDLGAQVNAVFKGGADVIFDTTGFWLPASVAALATFGRIAISPGLDPRQPLVSTARARGIPVIGEMDLFVQALLDRKSVV